MNDAFLAGLKSGTAGKKSWNLGFFSRPFRLASGPYKGRIVKFYRPVADRPLCESVAENHDLFVRKLRSAGIRVPDTELRIVPLKRKFRLTILQSAFREDELVRGWMARGSKKECLSILGALLGDTLKFLSWKRRSGETIGFHPTLRNYALRKGKLWYFDTFPPMWGWDQKELNRIIVVFAPFSVFRILYFFSKKWVDRVTNEYFRDDLMISGIVGSSCRLRPDLAEDFLSFGRTFLAGKVKDTKLLKKLRLTLSRPPKLPGIWVFLRRLVGKEGRPNI